MHDKCLYHYGQGVKINQPIVEIVASELKSNFLNSTNISRRWIEGFLDKKGYSWKKLRGSKGYTPESDLEACRQEIRLQTKNYDPKDIYNFDETGWDLQFPNSYFGPSRSKFGSVDP